MRKFILILSTMLFTVNSFAQEMCSGIFIQPGLKVSTGSYSTNTQSTSSDEVAMALGILKMTTNTLTESISKKMTVEKGELLLGQNLGDGWSLEYEYFADKRTEKTIFRLGKVNLIKPNGEKTTIDKKPTKEDGNSLSKKFYSEEDLGFKAGEAPAVFANAPAVEFPALIQQNTLKYLLSMASSMEFFTRDEINQATDLKTLKAKAFVKSNVKYVQGIIKKQAFKFVLLGVVMYGYYSEKDKVIDMISPRQDSWKEIIKGTELAPLMRALDILGISSKDSGVKASRGKRDEPGVSSDELLRMVRSVVKTEKNSDGDPEIYLLDNTGVRQLNPKSLNAALHDMSEDSNRVVVVKLPQTERIVVVEDGLTSDAVVYGVDRASHSKTYDAISDALTAKIPKK